MKKLAAALLCILAFASCSKFSVHSLVGVWNIDSINCYESKNGQTSPRSRIYNTITFKRGGVGYAGDNPFNYTLNGERLDMKFLDGKAWECTIENLTPQSLVFSYEETGKYFGSPTMYLFRYTYNLTRVE